MSPQDAAPSLRTARQRIEIIDTALDLAITFVQIAENALDEPDSEHLHALLEKARHEHTVTAGFLARVADEKEKQRLNRKRDLLGNNIADVERRAASRPESRPGAE